MSYDLAVWEGDRPSDDAAAAALFEQLYEKYLDKEYRVPPTPRIRAYVEALLERWHIEEADDEDVDDDDWEDDSPWSTGGLMNSASGPIVYLAMVFSRCEEVSAGAARMAADRGLVCFDPQMSRLRPAAGER
ncbi:hypothetical protein ONA91_15770 [Micromonospora sp. DR5-3]|uniref:hypothetical protein n=1 Tax=unclassified Micromonospora TaxID=2617518 RepID=UPI0011D567D1|nr:MULTISPECIES: hypothetical protein [unclassified Micromonospora]MCW3815903.1 hypothetical protein [Micromonospora sp. DR5-3]TYC24411.1 hypothetical protein FXF52_10405 [Micromonospora sp. MP36]